jgi:hypothetical protein
MTTSIPIAGAIHEAVKIVGDILNKHAQFHHKCVTSGHKDQQQQMESSKHGEAIGEAHRDMDFDGAIGKRLGISQARIGAGNCHEIDWLDLLVTGDVLEAGAKLERLSPLNGSMVTLSEHQVVGFRITLDIANVTVVGMCI